MTEERKALEANFVGLDSPDTHRENISIEMGGNKRFILVEMEDKVLPDGTHEFMGINVRGTGFPPEQAVNVLHELSHLLNDADDVTPNG